MKLLPNYSLDNHMYIYLNECKQITEVKLLQLHSCTEIIYLLANK